MDDIQTLLAARSQARADRSWAEADRLRGLIEAKGYQVVDRKDGTSELKSGSKLQGATTPCAPIENSYYLCVMDAKGRTGSYDINHWDSKNKQLVQACSINDVESQSAFVQAAIAKHKQRCKSMCLFCGTQPPMKTERYDNSY